MSLEKYSGFFIHISLNCLIANVDSLFDSLKKVKKLPILGLYRVIIISRSQVQILPPPPQTHSHLDLQRIIASLKINIFCLSLFVPF